MSRTNKRLKKSPTWSVVDGPPMFINTIAVGPLAPTLLCVTGGATVAIFDLWVLHCEIVAVDDRANKCWVLRFANIVAGWRNELAILKIDNECMCRALEGQINL